MMTCRLLTTTALLIAGLIAGHPAHAETYQTCAGFIDTLPTTITTQGVWCLKKDLATAITSGNAITIATNNVTIDCNDFKIGGLAAGNGSQANGIYAANRQNATIRRCNVRGFYSGINLVGSSGGGHLVEDNRLDNNLAEGISVSGDNNMVRRNRVYDTGGAMNSTSNYGIYAQANLIENIVSGLFADVAGGYLRGIGSFAIGAEVRGNTVSGFDMTARQGGAVSTAYGIVLGKDYQRASENQVVGDGAISGYGFYTTYSTDYCLDNSVGGFAMNIISNCISSGNLTSP